MKRKKLIIGVGSLIIGLVLTSTSALAQDTTATEVADSSEQEVVALTGIDAGTGLKYFEGSKRLKNGGPACIACHNVTNDKLIPGGLMAKDLTDVYDRLGEGITAWLDAPPFPAMVSSYKDHPLTLEERTALTAFFKHSTEVKGEQQTNAGWNLFIVGGIVGLIVIIIMINFIWMKRKRTMVKQDIFKRQNKAWDAKF